MPQHPLSHLFCMVMNGGQRNGVLYQRTEPSCLSHGAGEVALCHGGRLLSTPSILQNMPHCWRKPTPFTRLKRKHSCSQQHRPLPWRTGYTDYRVRMSVLNLSVLNIFFLII